MLTTSIRGEEQRRVLSASEQASAAQSSGASAGRYGPQRAAVMISTDERIQRGSPKQQCGCSFKTQKGTRGNGASVEIHTTSCCGCRSFIRISESSSTRTHVAQAQQRIGNESHTGRQDQEPKSEAAGAPAGAAAGVPAGDPVGYLAATPSGKLDEAERQDVGSNRH